MTFPSPQTIGHRAYVEGAAGFGGNPAITYSPAVGQPATSIAVYAVYFETPSEDYEPGRNRSRIPIAILGSKTALGSIAARDRIEWPYGGNTYEVDGEPEDFTDGPFGFEPGLRIRAIRTEG